MKEIAQLSSHGMAEPSQLCRQNDEKITGTRQVDELCSSPRADNMSDATVMLTAIKAGDSKAAEELLVLVYDEVCVGASRSGRTGEAALFCGFDERGSFTGHGSFSFHSQKLLGLLPCLDPERNSKQIGEGAGELARQHRQALRRYWVKH